MTFEELCRIEPRLKALELDIRGEAEVSKGKERYCANEAWYGEGLSSNRKGYKGVMYKLVGWEAEKKEIQTYEAYDTALHHLYNLLPYCRNCACTPSSR